MKLNIELSVQSVDQAIKTIQFISKQYKNGKMITEFLEQVCEWIIKRANSYLNMSDIGELVKIDIRNGWEYIIKDGSATISNSTDKAVFVEFGVGLVGETRPHPNAKNQSSKDYEYNLPTISKDANGMWYFWANNNELDIPRGAIVDITSFNDYDRNGKVVLRGKSGEQGKRVVVGTMGTEGVMYAYNAIVDATMDFKNPNGEIAKIWQRLQKEYIERYLQ